jgi:hypothetical protein
MVRLTRDDLLWGGLVTLLAIATALLAVGNLVVAAPPVLVLVIYLIVTRSWVRMIVVVAGGLIVLQSDSVAAKLVYVAAASLCFAIACGRVPAAMRTRPAIRAFRPVLIASLALGCLIFLSLATSSASGVPEFTWFRAALPYMLLAALPIIGLDVAIDTSYKAVKRGVIIFGLIAPLAFMTDWLARRGASSLPIGRFAFGSIPMCAMLLGYALARLAVPGRRFLWFTAAVYVPLAVMLTGARSGLALFGGFLGAIGATYRVRLSPARAAAGVIGLGAAVYYLIPLVGARLVEDPDFYTRRFSSLPSLLGSTQSLASDQSAYLRQLQTETAFDAFQNHIFFGEGLAVPHTGITIYDTPIGFLAYFGIAGILVLAWLAFAWTKTLREMRKLTGYSVELTTVRVFVVTLVCYLPLSLTFDDKGLSLSVFLLTALLASSAEHGKRDAPAKRGRWRDQPAPTAGVVS